MQVLYDDGYTAIESDTEGEETYSYQGLSGSLDHVLGNDAAMPLVTGADVWNINSGESVAFEYSRYNSNATNFYDDSVYRSSDHDPEIVGIRDPRATPALEVKATPQSVRAEKDRVKLHIAVAGGDVTPTGRVDATTPGQPTLTGRLEDGTLNLRLSEFTEPGTYPVVVSYSGDGAHQRSRRHGRRRGGAAFVGAVESHGRESSSRTGTDSYDVPAAV